VISEIRSRGAGGAGDEYVALWNPTASAVTLDTNWILEGRSSSATAYNKRWTGTGKTIPARGHFLIAYTGYTQTPSADEALTSGITDATSLRLVQSGTTVDAVCYAFDAASALSFTSDATYTCEGTPVTNPHDNTIATNTDAAIARAPGGGAGSCTDSGDNAADFVMVMPGGPLSASSPPTP
jgi:hypothetical protein